MSHSRDQVVDLGSVQLAVQDRGQGDPPLLLVHGYTGSKLDWADVIDDLAEGRRVIGYDHRGHGESTNLGSGDSYSLEHLESDFQVLLDSLGTDVVDLLGHSMGGMVALRAVLARPERVRSLILMDTSADPVRSLPKRLFAGLAEVGREEGMPALHTKIRPFMEQRTAAIRSHLPSEMRATFDERNRTKFAQLDVEAFEALATTLSEFEPMSPRLGEIRCPTTVIVGQHDTGTEEGDRGFRGAAEALAKGIDAAELRVIPTAGHCPQEDNREAWLVAVREHLSRVGA